MGEELAVGCGYKWGCEEEVAVAGKNKNFGVLSGVAKNFSYFLNMGALVIGAEIDIEEVAENKNRVRILGVFIDKCFKFSDKILALRAQV